MKHRTTSFRKKLWAYFALFAVVILSLLWLLQTVFLQNMYESMVTKTVERAAASIRSTSSGITEDDLDRIATNNSLLIVVTDRQGNLLYSTDEHNSIYRGKNFNRPGGIQNSTPQGRMAGNGQKGQRKYLSLPDAYEEFLNALQQNKNEAVSLRSEDGQTLIYGFIQDNSVYYISTSLSAVGSTVAILRTQLVLVSAVSLVLSWILAWLLAKRFSSPLTALSRQAENLSDGQFDPEGIRGFSEEIDQLADNMETAAKDITQARNYQKEFLANISHDLRTPLTMIRGYAELVRDISWQDEEKRESDLSVIIREAERLNGLVDEILTYSEIEAGKLPLQTETFNFSEMTQDILAQFEPLCMQEEYRIRSEIEPGIIITGDKKKLERVVYNLIDNAISHTGESKEIAVRLSRKDRSARLEVQDYGPGIPADVLPHIWERYFKASQQKRNKKGSGLGLAICKEILEQHEAKYGVESAEGSGSCFWLELSLI